LLEEQLTMNMRVARWALKIAAGDGCIVKGSGEVVLED